MASLARRSGGGRVVAFAAAATALLLAACGASVPQATGGGAAAQRGVTGQTTPDPSITPSPLATPPPSTTSAATGPPATPTPSPVEGGFSAATVLAVVGRTYPSSPSGTSGGCQLSACPFTPRLVQQLEHLASQTPSPTRQGDVCNYDLQTGNQTGFATPVNPQLGSRPGASTASVPAVNPTVMLVIVDSGGQALVDDILYPANGERSVYSLSCTGSS